MGVRAPKARKHLSADALFSVVRSLFATIPDDRRSEAATAVDGRADGGLRHVFAQMPLAARL